MPEMKMQWELSQSLTSDGQGIRCACVLPATTEEDAYRIVTGTQGGQLCIYSIPSGNIQIPQKTVHNHAITALLSSVHKNIYISGCKDAMIRIIDATTHECLVTLPGHEKPVTSLAWASEDHHYLLSGSWDGTARLWNIENMSLVATMADHENSVCVTGLQRHGNEIVLATGSAGIAQGNTVRGHTVRLFRVNVATGEVERLKSSANDHQGPIRDILFSNGQLATCSNDGTVKLRDTSTGQVISTLTFALQQHPPMLLSMTSPRPDALIASAEDGHVVVWTPGTEPQIIRHAECVWNVVDLPQQDFATCCQDGTLRIFTHAAERVAPGIDREAFLDQVQTALQRQAKGPSSEDIAKLPRWEQRDTMQSRSEGQVQVFQKDGVAIAAQWSAASSTWIEVGQVMGTNENTGTLNGVQYDHVFPIEVDQAGGGVANLQIGYNNGENPFVAAQRFIDEHVLPQHHLREIADYIQQRVGQQGTTLGAAPAATTGMPMISYNHLPIKIYKVFHLPEKTAVTTLEKMKGKIEEYGFLSGDELGHLASLLDTLASGNRYHVSKVTKRELEVVWRMLEQLPADQVFPAIDLARLTVLHPDAASRDHKDFWSKSLIRIVELTETPEASQGPAIPMLSLRLFANAFKGGPGALEAVSALLDAVLRVAHKFVCSSNKNVRLSVATLLFNIAHYLHSKSFADSFAPILVPMLGEILDNRNYEGEAIFRALQALGTIAMVSKLGKDAANGLYLASKVEMMASPHGAEVKIAAKEVYNVLQ